MSVPFTVRARLSAGYAHATPWGISLDGLLASEVWESRKATARATNTEWSAYDVRTVPEGIDLPLSGATAATETGIGRRRSRTPKTPCQVLTYRCGPAVQTSRHWRSSPTTFLRTSTHVRADSGRG